MKKIEYLITGGTGSLGKELLSQLIQRKDIKGIRCYSRDELKQYHIRNQFKDCKVPIAYIIGDIRDYERLKEALKDVDKVIHTAALKQVPTAEENPLEFVRTNVLGTENVMRACIANNVNKALLISTDKAVAPINLYGATKMCAEKIWLKGSIYSGGKGTQFAVVRYGNVIGSRGSVIDLINNLTKGEKIPITDPDMTRFWIKLSVVAKFIINRINNAYNFDKTIAIPKMMSCTLEKFIRASTDTTPDNWKIVGIREGEKIHEQMINEEEKKRTKAYKDAFVIQPNNCHGVDFNLFSDNRNPLFEFKPEKIKKILEN